VNGRNENIENMMRGNIDGLRIGIGRNGSTGSMMRGNTDDWRIEIGRSLVVVAVAPFCLSKSFQVSELEMRNETVTGKHSLILTQY